MTDIKDLITFLTQDQQDDIKKSAISFVTQLSGTQDGLKMMYRDEKLMEVILSLIDSKNEFISKASLRIIINISAEKEGANAILSTKFPIVHKVIEYINNPQYSNADFCCGILVNLSRDPSCCERVLNEVGHTKSKLEGLIFIFCQMDYNKSGSKLHLLSLVINNFSQIYDGRMQLLNKEKCIFQRLLPFIEFSSSKERRKAIIGAIHNCCFEKAYHEWLLNEDIDIASHLCLPLAGPDIYTIEENESLPLNLQFLTDDKTREPDVEIRILLLEALMQLCVNSVSRKKLRDVNIYLIMREHHKWEENEICLGLIEDIVNLLIRSEEEIGEDDLSALQIPSDISNKFMDFNVNHSLEAESSLFIK